MATVTHPHRSPSPHHDSFPTRIRETMRNHKVATVAVVAGLAGVIGLSLAPKGQTSAEDSQTAGRPAAGAQPQGGEASTGAAQTEAVALPAQPEHPANYFPEYELGANAPESSDPQEYLNQFFYQIEATYNTNDEQFLRIAEIDTTSELGRNTLDYAQYNATQRDTAGSVGFDTLIPVLTGQRSAPGDVKVYEFNLFHMYQDAGDLPWRAVMSDEGQAGYTGSYELFVSADEHTVESRFISPLEIPSELQ